jgi:hypothetical protein
MAPRARLDPKPRALIQPRNAGELEESPKLIALPRPSACAAFVLAAFSLAAFPLASSAARAEPALVLAPHRAVYELKLLTASGTKAPAQARGRIAFDFTGSACEGYVQNFRQITELQPEEGSARVSDMRSATFEAGDGHDYRFQITTRVDGGVDNIDGDARKTQNQQFSVEMTKPKRERLDLAGPVLFPTEHIRHILASARAQETILEARVYDGSGDGSKIFETTTVIGKPLATAANEKPAQIDALKSVRRWPVTISYFEANKKDEGPAYVLSFDLYENGISRALRLDYGDFVLGGEMTDLKLLPAQKCDK